MPTLPSYASLRHLSSDPVSGIPYFYHSTDTLTAIPSSTVLLNPPVLEIPSNMLGARARAAEYNAAKAATARQQATRESEELRLPPRPAPISLSAFTRNASYSRNRGAKNFVPLILSEEEEKKSTSSSTELASERDHSDSPQAEYVLRPASLPPPQTTLGNSVEMEHTAQTPMRYKSPRSQMQHYTTTPRSVHNEDGYFPVAGMAFSSHHFVPYQQPRAYISHPNMIPAHHIGWYTPTSYYGTHCSYPDVGVVPIASFTEPRPRLNHNLSRESTAVSESATESPLKPSPAKKRPVIPVAKLGGPTLHVFGPDDLSPTKMEIKQQTRQKYFANQPGQQATPTTTRATESVSVSRSPKHSLMESLVRSAQVPKHNIVNNTRLQPVDVQDSMIDHDNVATVSVRKSSASAGLFSKLRNQANFQSFELGGNADDIWSTKDTESLYRQTTASDGSPVRHSRNNRCKGLDRDLDRMFAGSIQRETGAKIIEKSDSSFTSLSAHAPRSQTPVKDPERLRREREQRFVIERLLTYPDNPEWWQIHGSSAEDRERIMMLRRAMSSSLDPTGESPGLSVIKQEEVRIQYQQSRGAYERRRKRVHELADEMKHKWEYGGQFRGPAMTKEEAKKYAGTVEEIGHMMAMLGILAGCNQGGLGSRPYVQPPEYAIERSICMDKEGTVSLFEQEGDEIRAAPPRLARDPRFRAQMSEGMKIRGDEERIPRMFVSRTRMQT